MINPFHSASAKLAAIGQSILSPVDSIGPTENSHQGPGEHQDESLPESWLAIASIQQGDMMAPLAFSTTGNLTPRIELNSALSVSMKLVWGQPLATDNWLNEIDGQRTLVPPEPLQPGLYELSIDLAILHFVIYDPAFPQIPLQIEPLADIPTHQENVRRSPNILGIVFTTVPTDSAISQLCRENSLKPVSYAKNLKLLMVQKFASAQDSFTLLEQIKINPNVQRAFIPGERTILSGERPGRTTVVAIDRPNFEVPAETTSTLSLLS